MGWGRLRTIFAAAVPAFLEQPGHEERVLRGIASVRGVEPVKAAELRPGDIGFMDRLQHHFVAAAVSGDGTIDSIDSIDGNGCAGSEVAFHARRPVASASGFYTAFRR